MSFTRDTFARIFRDSDDPWGFRTQWYEQRKRAMTLACLASPHYRRAYEPGCANGELLAELASRCDEIVGMDGVPAAVELARARTAALANVKVVQGWIPQDFAVGPFELIVFSEIGYFLTLPELEATLQRMRQALAAEATVLACHWRHPIEGGALSGDDVHRALDARLALPRIAHHEEADFVIDVWSTDARSVAQRAGLVDTERSGAATQS